MANFRVLSCAQYEVSVFDRKRTFMIIKLKKNFGPFLPIRGDPYQKKNSKFFSLPNMKIHTPPYSPCRVDKKYVASKLSDFWPKKPKNSVKIRYF